MIPYLTTAMQQAAKYAELASAQNTARTMAVYAQQQAQGPDVQPPRMPPEGGGGKGGACSASSFAVDALGLAFLTIGIMSGIGGIFEGAAWAGIATWGGGATTVYGVANRWLC